MDHLHLRAIILKLQDRLSDDDRRRLHFFLGNDVPRRIRDDPSLAGTLCLMESLFDQDKINEQDFTFLINAFDEIQCIDAVKLLKGKSSRFIPADGFIRRKRRTLIPLEHMRRIQANEINQSVQSLISIMPQNIDRVLQDLENDKLSSSSGKSSSLPFRSHSIVRFQFISVLSTKRTVLSTTV